MNLLFRHIRFTGISHTLHLDLYKAFRRPLFTSISLIPDIRLGRIGSARSRSHQSVFVSDDVVNTKNGR